MISLKKHRISISFSFGFFAVWAFILAVRPDCALYLMISCILHESGHIIAAKAAGIPISSLHFYCGGISMKCGIPLEMQRFTVQLAVLASGCAVNFLLAFLFMDIKRSFALINLAIAMFNLLPVSSLDGGRLISALVRYNGGSCEDLLKKLDILWGILFIAGCACSHLVN